MQITSHPSLRDLKKVAALGMIAELTLTQKF